MNSKLITPLGKSFENAGIDSNNRYLYNGKEIQDQEIGGTTFGWYDYGARFYDPEIARWHSADPLAEKYYMVSSYVYCNNNFVNAIDPDGRLVIFINGMHSGSGGTAKYWEGVDKKIMKRINDFHSDYIDGSLGGTSNLPYNLSVEFRDKYGYEAGKEYAKMILFANIYI